SCPYRFILYASSLFFFFSSRRRHTRSTRDWSSDVCSSDLDARDANELAFALGALAHYITDNTGHPEAVNRSVPLLFPKLRAKYRSEERRVGKECRYRWVPEQ